MNSPALTDMKKGDREVIKGIAGSELLNLRLSEIGFVPGSQVTMMYSTPFGDPIIYQVRGSQIALRNEEAKCVLIK